MSSGASLLVWIDEGLLAAGWLATEGAGDTDEYVGGPPAVAGLVVGQGMQDLPAAASLFSESQSRIVVTVAEDDALVFIDALAEANVPYSVIGEVVGDRLTICQRLDLPVDELREAWEPTLEALLHGEVAPSGIPGER